jgi:ATP-dependent DNA helicase RecQ
VPPYVIFHDATLREIAAARPQSLDELGQVNGVARASWKPMGRLSSGWSERIKKEDARGLSPRAPILSASAPRVQPQSNVAAPQAFPCGADRSGATPPPTPPLVGRRNGVQGA